MVIILLLISQPLDLERLYNSATTLLVQFQEEQKASFDSLIELGQDSVYADTTLAYLVEQFDTKSAIERHRLKDIFKAIGPGAISAITMRIDERGKDVEDRRLKQSLWVLGEIGGDSIVKPVGRFISDSSWSIRSGAFTALGKSKSSGAHGLIIQGLDDSIAVVRKSAYYALSQIASEKDIRFLVQGLDDPYYGVRYAALHGLVMMDSLAYDALTDIARSSGYNAFYAIKGLCTIGPSSEVWGIGVQNRSEQVRFLVYSMCEEVAALRGYLEQEDNKILRNCIQRRIGEIESQVDK